MKDKQGSEIAIGAVIAAVIALFVLIMVILGAVYGKGGGAFEYLKTILPTFSTDDHKITSDIIKVRYSLVGNALQYYDGKQWLALEKNSYTFNNKRISVIDLQTTFDRYYFAQAARSGQNEKWALEDKAASILYEKEDSSFISSIPPIDAVIIGITKGGTKEDPKVIYRGGDVLLRFYSKERESTKDSRIFGEYAVDLDNKGRLRKVYKDGSSFTLRDSFETTSSTSSEYVRLTNEINSWAGTWRDSVFSKTITLSYYNTDTNKGESVTTCVLYLDKTLIVDFNDPQTSCAGGISA